VSPPPSHVLPTPGAATAATPTVIRRPSSACAMRRPPAAVQAASTSKPAAVVRVPEEEEETTGPVGRPVLFRPMSAASMRSGRSASGHIRETGRRASAPGAALRTAASPMGKKEFLASSTAAFSAFSVVGDSAAAVGAVTSVGGEVASSSTRRCFDADGRNTIDALLHDLASSC
jgi:hypothetical protein